MNRAGMDEISAYFARIGAKGGSATSAKKAMASRKNGGAPRKDGLPRGWPKGKPRGPRKKPSA